MRNSLIRIRDLPETQGQSAKSKARRAKRKSKAKERRAKGSLTSARLSAWPFAHCSLSPSRKHQIYVPPILCRARALAGPIRIVVEMVRHLRRPETRDVAIVQIAFNRLAQPRGPSRRVRFPSRRKHQRTAQRKMRPLRWRPLRKRVNVTVFRRDELFDSSRLPVDGFHVFHIAFLSSNRSRYLGLRAAISP